MGFANDDICVERTYIWDWSKKYDTYICDWSDDYDTKLKYYRDSTAEDLIAILEEQFFFEEFHYVLKALYEKKPKKAIKLAKAMLEGGMYKKWVPIENPPSHNDNSVYMRPATVDDLSKGVKFIEEPKWDAWTISDLLRFIGSRDYRYALEYLKKNIDTMEYPVLETALDCLAARYEETIDNDLLQKIIKAYNSYDEFGRECVDSYEYLMKAMESLKKQEYRTQLRKFARKNRLREILR